MEWEERLKNMSTQRKEKHHVLAKSRNGSNKESNLLKLTVRGHACLHTLFGHKTLLESATELRRWEITKGLMENDWLNTSLFKTAYELMFGNKTFRESADYLIEIDVKLKAGDFNFSKSERKWKTRITRIKKDTGRFQ